jgi:ABC-type nitrate/sulfonate/bicarbonate transport system substrate-binding protein
VAASGSGSAVTTLSILESGKSFYDVPLYAMMNDGFGTANHLKLSLAQFNSGGGSTAQIFAGGTGNILAGGIDTVAAIGQSGKLDVTVLGTWTQRNYFRLVSKAGSKYRTLADLRGQTIGVSGAGSFTDLAVRNLLRQNGLQPDRDVKIAALGQPAAQLAALESGSVAAIMLNPPTIYVAQQKKEVQTIHNFENDPVVPSALFTARTADVEKNPAPYRNFINAYDQTIAKMRSDPSFAAKVAAADWGTTTAPIVLTQELKEFLYSPGVWSPSGAFTKELYNNGRQLLLGSGKVSAKNFPTYQALTAHSPAG